MDETLKLDIKRAKLAGAGKMHIVHWFIVLLSVILTFSAWYYSKAQVNQKLEIKFQRNAEQVVDIVKERMELYENALRSAVAYLDSTEQEINNNQWVTYTGSLKIEMNYPGINGMGIIHNLQPNQLDEYLSKQRILRPYFAVHPKHEQGEHWPITYLAPAAPNSNAIGLDVAFEANRYSSIKKARDSGEPQLTGPITLVQDAKKTPGFLFYEPFYKDGLKPESVEERRKLIVGVTFAPFIMKNLMQGTLAEHNRHVSLQISDAGDVLYDDKDNVNINIRAIDPRPLFSNIVDVDLYGRVWSFNMQSNMNFRNESSTNQSIFILIGGLTIDALLLGLFVFLSQANRRALHYADRMTAELEDKTKHLEKSNEDLEQFSYIASHDLKSPLNAIKQLTSWIKEDCEEILPESSKKHLTLLTQRSERMMKLLNDLLEYSRMNRKKVRTELVNLQTMSQDIAGLLNMPKNFTYSAPNISIIIAPEPLEIVLRNLMSNAIKHHDKESGQISISYEQSPVEHIIVVEDDGPGIPEALQEKAMEMFQTLKSRDKVEGSGMGLAMVKRIITQYQGSITIHSDGKRGTKITITWEK